MPILVVILLIVGFVTGLFNIPCFCKFLGIITGIYIIILIIRCRNKEKEEEKIKEEAYKQARAEIEKISKIAKADFEDA